MRNSLLQDTFERVARTISTRANVEVVVRGNESPRTNGRTIWLPSIPSNCSPEVERALHGVLDHETAHCMWTNFKTAKPFRKKWGERGFHVLNALEDLRIEFRLEREYPGAKLNLAQSHESCLAKWKENADQLPLWPRTIAALIGLGKGWNLDMFGDDAIQVACLVEDIVMQAPRARSTKEAAHLAEQILERWKAVLSQGDEKSGEQSSTEGSQSSENGSQEAEGGTSSSEPHSESSAKTEDAGKAEKVDTSQEGQSKPVSDAVRNSVRTLFESEPTDQAPNLGRYLQSTLTELSAGGSNMPYRVFSTAEDVVEVAPDLGLDSYNELMEAVRPHVSALRQKLLLTLRAKAQSRWVPDLNGHRLDRRRLHTLCLDTVTAPPFVSRAGGTNQNVAFSLLVDQSGSMRGEKIRLACQCSALLAETLDKLGLPLEVIGFTTVNDRRYLARLPKVKRKEIEAQFARFIPLQHTIFKKFGEPFRRCRGRFAAMQGLAYTPINESVLFAGKRLIEQKAERRVLVVLTDGMTFLGNAQTQKVAQRNLSDNLERLGRCGIEVVAVGIQAPYVNQVFEKAIVIDEVSELPKQFYHLMSDLLLRGMKAAA